MGITAWCRRGDGPVVSGREGRGARPVLQYFPGAADKHAYLRMILRGDLPRRATMENPNPIAIEEVTGQVLVVDDDRTICHLHQGLLAGQFQVRVAHSGAEALAECARVAPDLVLLDVEMPGLNGYEVCRRLRESATFPIIFVTQHQSLEEHVRAFDAGGSDIITKPVAREILLRKVALAIHQHRLMARLSEEKDSLNRMAMGFLSSMGQNGVLLNFMRSSVACRSHRALAENLIRAMDDLGVHGSVLLRHDGGTTVLTHHGDPTPLELAILQQVSGLERVFQFSRRLVVNYERVSILVADMPDERMEAERAGQLRDNVAILAEAAEAWCDLVDMRMESMRRAEQLQLALSGSVHAIGTLRRRYADTLVHTEDQLHRLVDAVEHSYSWLDTNQAQEQAISGVMQEHMARILALLADHQDVDAEFDKVMGTLRGGEASHFELF